MSERKSESGSLRHRSRSGQAMIEYLSVAIMVIASLSILALLLYAFREHGGRVLDLVGSDYP